MRSGIAAAGNWIIDRVKVIDVYPTQDALANILAESSSNGGAPYNVLKALSKLGLDIPLEGIGLVGNDLDGKRILEDCELHGIKTSQLRQTIEAPTSYTDVMSVKETGRRTFFHQRGANALLRAEHFDFETTRSSHLHLGYLLLLDSLDEPDEIYGTAAARVLADAKSHGLTTSIDIVSEDSDRFRDTVLPALKFADVVFMNEFELSRTTGHLVSGTNTPELLKAGEALMAEISGHLVVHTPLRVFAFSKNGTCENHGSVNLPDHLIRGAVGAGDAFAAGFLASHIQGNSIQDCLRTGVCVAASSLLAPDSSSGILPLDDCFTMANEHGYH